MIYCITFDENAPAGIDYYTIPYNDSLSNINKLEPIERTKAKETVYLF